MEDHDYNYSTSAGGKTSQFNSGFLEIIRLDYLKKEMHKFAQRGQYVQWNEALDRHWIELIADSKPDDQTKIEKFNKQLETLGLYLNLTPNGFDLAPPFAQALKTKQKGVLMLKEACISRIQNASGKGTKYVDPDEDDFD